MKRDGFIFDESGFSMTELLVALVIIGVLVLLALPRLMPIVNKAKATEAKLNLNQVYMLEKAFKLENDRYSNNLTEIGFEQETLVTNSGTARYEIKIVSADVNAFRATATSVVDFDNDGNFNVWEINDKKQLKETIAD
jgi:type IV pilus assembly protein PilE